MKSLDYLREAIRRDVNNPWSNLKDYLLMLVDEVEAEIDELYMPLPLDADGVLIHIGDKVEDGTGCGPIEVMSLTYFEDCCDVNACGLNPRLLRHVTPRTVEDVLEEFFCIASLPSSDETRNRDEIVSDYANELRELMGGE